MIKSLPAQIKSTIYLDTISRISAEVLIDMLLIQQVENI